MVFQLDWQGHVTWPATSAPSSWTVAHGHKAAGPRRVTAIYRNGRSRDGCVAHTHSGGGARGNLGCTDRAHRGPVTLPTAGATTATEGKKRKREHPKCAEVVNGGRCTSNAERHGSKPDKCKKHGGGKRCVGILAGGTPCPKTAQGKTDKCIKHGGGKRCVGILLDGSPCPNSAAGKTDKCITCGRQCVAV